MRNKELETGFKGAGVDVGVAMGQLEGGPDRMPQNPARPETEQRYEAEWVGPLFIGLPWICRKSAAQRGGVVVFVAVMGYK